MMGLGGKKAKAKEKNGKAGTKQKIKKAKSPDVVEITEPTEDNELIEGHTIVESPAPASTELVLQEPELSPVSEPAVEHPIAVEDFLEKTVPAPSSPSPSQVKFDDEKKPDTCPSEPLNEHIVEKEEQFRDHSNDNNGGSREEHCDRNVEESCNKPFEDQASQPTTQRNTPEPPSGTNQEHPVYETTYPQYPSYPSYPTDYPERAFNSSPFAPFSPAPALVPLPSPSLTEARFMSSASPEAHYYPYYPPPPPLPFAPYAAPAYSVPYYHSPIPKVSSPLARSHYSYVSPAMSPTATPPPPPAAPAAPVAQAASVPPPSTVQSHASLVQSPVMSSAGVVPPYGPYTPPQPLDSHFMHRSWSGSDQPYAASFQAIQNLGLGNGQVHENGTISPPENDQEHLELLQRIQAAIPDINRLLHGFRHTHTKLSSREAEIKQIGSQHEQALMHKDFYIEALQAQMKKTANESAEECAKLKNTINELRLELGNLQEQQRDLEDGLASHQKTNEELSQCKSELEVEIEKLNASIKEAQEKHAKDLETQKEEHAKALTTQKQELTELFEEIKNEDEKAAAELLEAREKELRDQHELAKGEWEKEKTSLEETIAVQRSELETTKSELASKIASLEAKETELATQLAELNTAREEVASKVAKLEAKEKEVEEIRQKSAHDLEALQQGHTSEQEALRTNHTGELESLRQAHQEQVEATAQALNDRIAAIEDQLHEQEKHWEAERVALQKLLVEKDEELNSIEREKDKLEGDGLIKEQQLQRAVEEMKSTIDHLDHDRDRLRRTLQSLGEATDLKTTKGDQFFVDCFSQLSALISDLAHDYFAYLPIDPPKDILSKIPSEIPFFLDNTPASRALRAAYVQHIVSKTLTYRVFQPFLFTLGRRYDKADTFFQMLSMDIRRKSVRREAFWRQQTLKAAYTTSDAKQSINVAAAVIVDEIIDHIRHFADPRQLDSLLTAVRKIVKLAAETWRHARVERELVIASFPAPDAEAVDNEGWSEYAAPGSSPATPAGSPKSEPSRHVVLRTFPRVVREAAHEDFASGPDRATSCVYSTGEVLYSDSLVVMARLEELAKKSTEMGVIAEEEKLRKKAEDTLPSPPETPPDDEVKVDLGAGSEPVAPVRSSTPPQVQSPQPARSPTPVRSSTPAPAKSPLPARSATPVKGGPGPSASLPGSPRGKGQVVKA